MFLDLDLDLVTEEEKDHAPGIGIVQDQDQGIVEVFEVWVVDLGAAEGVLVHFLESPFGICQDWNRSEKIFIRLIRTWKTGVFRLFLFRYLAIYLILGFRI